MGHPQIAAFARLADGSTDATRSIAGQNTLFSRTIHGMDYDPVRDEIVVPGWYNFSILTFSADADGDAAPVRQIMGPRTQLVNSQRVAVDPVNGEIFVPQPRRVLVFDRDADGDVAPIRILEGPDTGLRGEGRVAVDPVHGLLVVSGGGGIRIFDRTASGNTPPLRVITGGGGVRAIDPESGMMFATGSMDIEPDPSLPPEVRSLMGRYSLSDYVGVWSVFDDGPVPPRFTIGGPNVLLKDVRGIAVDARNQNVIVSDKTHNAIFTFNVPEAFQ